MTRQRDIPVLNGVRGLAVLIVFLSHASNIYFAGAVTGWGGGQLGVMLFFMLSGFLMAHLYMDQPASRGAVRQFVVNRMARIYPMFAVVVVFCFVVSRLGHVYVYPIRTLHEVIMHLTFVHGYEVLWTIGPEVIFYGLFVVAWILRHRSMAAMSAYLSVLVLLGWLPLQSSESNSLLELHDKLPFFIVGTVMGIYSARLLAFAHQRTRWMPWVFWISGMIFLFGMPRILVHVGSVPAHLAGDPWPHPWGYPFYLFATSALFLASLIARPSILTNRVAQFAGRISFSFYLLHFMVLKNLQPLLPTHPLRSIVLAVLVTTALSWLTYRLIEVPARRMLRKLGKRAPNRPLMAQS